MIGHVIEQAVENAELIFFSTGHRKYLENWVFMQMKGKHLTGVIDGCNLYQPEVWERHQIGYTGIGRGIQAPEPAFIDFVLKGFAAMEKGLANELKGIIDFLNARYARTTFNKIDFKQVQRLAAGCSTGCIIADYGPIEILPDYHGFTPELVKHAFQFSQTAVDTETSKVL